MVLAPCKQYTLSMTPTFIAPIPSLSSVSALSNRSVFHKDCFAPCKIPSCVPTAPALPPGNPALSSYIPRSDCGLYCCFLLSVPTGIPSLSDFAPPCPFRKGLFESEMNLEFKSKKVQNKAVAL